MERFSFEANSVEINETAANRFEVYPNPAYNKIYIENIANQNTHYTLIDLLGNLIMQGDLTQTKIVVDIADLTQGVYILQLQSSNNLITKSIIKQ